MARRVQNGEFGVFFPPLLCKLSRFQQTATTTEKSENKQITHVWPHCVVTGLSKISRQTGQTNSDTSLLPSEAAFLCCAALNPPSIAISFLYGSGLPVMTSAGPALHTRGGGVIDDSPTHDRVFKKENKKIFFVRTQTNWDDAAGIFEEASNGILHEKETFILYVVMLLILRESKSTLASKM